VSSSPEVLALDHLVLTAAGIEATVLRRTRATPGSADLCFLVAEPIEDVVRELGQSGIEIAGLELRSQLCSNESRTNRPKERPCRC
jgi:hypothetical protein